nr:hypothetical protein [Gleimia europaea]
MGRRLVGGLSCRVIGRSDVVLFWRVMVVVVGFVVGLLRMWIILCVGRIIRWVICGRCASRVICRGLVVMVGLRLGVSVVSGGVGRVRTLV